MSDSRHGFRRSASPPMLTCLVSLYALKARQGLPGHKAAPGRSWHVRRFYFMFTLYRALTEVNTIREQTPVPHGSGRHKTEVTWRPRSYGGWRLPCGSQRDGLAAHDSRRLLHDHTAPPRHARARTTCAPVAPPARAPALTPPAYPPHRPHGDLRPQPAWHPVPTTRPAPRAHT